MNKRIVSTALAATILASVVFWAQTISAGEEPLPKRYHYQSGRGILDTATGNIYGYVNGKLKLYISSDEVKITKENPPVVGRFQLVKGGTLLFDTATGKICAEIGKKWGRYIFPVNKQKGDVATLPKAFRFEYLIKGGDGLGGRYRIFDTATGLFYIAFPDAPNWKLQQ